MSERVDPHEDIGYGRDPREIEPARDREKLRRMAVELGLPEDASPVDIARAQMAAHQPADKASSPSGAVETDPSAPYLLSRQQAEERASERAEETGDDATPA